MPKIQGAVARGALANKKRREARRGRAEEVNAQETNIKAPKLRRLLNSAIASESKRNLGIIATLAGVRARLVSMGGGTTRELDTARAQKAEFNNIKFAAEEKLKKLAGGS